MLQSLLEGRIAKSERSYGVSLDYVRYVARHSKAMLWRLMRFVRLAEFRSPRIRDAMHVAAIAGSAADDCGSCVQIAVNLAVKDGVEREIISAAVNEQPELLSNDLQDVYRFTRAVVLDAPEQTELREAVRKRFGDRGLIELSVAIALHRVYPTLKRGLGFANSCSKVTVEV